MSLFENTHDLWMMKSNTIAFHYSARRIAMRLREVFKKNMLALMEKSTIKNKFLLV